ncbi:MULTISPECIES: class I tRNA ligase family protein [unclassified Bradyrhizobium]|uniref:class I tRNA ligase family protein n=1 Tax=unclassified Bradyrhizobium TaxID=2631580 RepID=UPI001FFAC4BC|nr:MULTISPECIES: class I tRNA ligase family protein [unclassified Bradyrhizobium]MCK1612701.1 class I tRNA ligase family protein [Bradyrhizobium sp. 163]MCK1767030.1 class I tRNA ligase family protein [Bradyrhizobium sp. 136]
MMRKLRDNIVARHFRASKFALESGESTRLDCHADNEMLFVFSGTGSVTYGDGSLSTKQLGPGDMLLMSPFTAHLIKNDGAELLVVGNAWWEDRQTVDESVKAPTKAPRTRLVLPSFTTPNGRMHVGHLAGPVVAADMFTRAQRTLGLDCYQLCGTLGFQTHVAITAAREGRSYHETSRAYSDDFLANYRLLGVDFDVFATLDELPRFERVAREFLATLDAGDHLIEKTARVPYCEHGHGYLFEAHVRGSCPHCGEGISSECENCALFVPDEELMDPVCNHCNRPAAWRPLKRMFVPLEPHRAVLERYLMSGAYVGKMPDFVARVLQRKLPDIPLGICSSDGLALPLHGQENQNLYSAVELAPRFLTAQDMLASRAELGSDEVELVLFFGSDNAYLRCITFPILLHLYHASRFRIVGFFGNEFYQLDGRKLSTSRGHVIYADDLTRQGIPADWLRLYVCHTRPSIAPTSFSFREAFDWIERRRGLLASVIHHISQSVETRHRGTVPEAGTWERLHRAFYQQLCERQQEGRRLFSVEEFDPRRIAELIDRLLHDLDGFATEALGARYHPGIERAACALSVAGLRLWATLAWPVMPGLCTALLARLGIREPPYLNHALQWVPAGRSFDTRGWAV